MNKKSNKLRLSIKDIFYSITFFEAAVVGVTNSFTGVTYSCRQISKHALKPMHAVTAAAYFGDSPRMEQHTFKNVNNCLNTNIYSFLETSDGQSSNL